MVKCYNIKYLLQNGPNGFHADLQSSFVLDSIPKSFLQYKDNGATL